MKIELNAEHNGIEIYFDGRPAPAQLEQLKTDGWRWHNAKKCWYAKDTAEHRNTAERFSIGSITDGQTLTQPTAPQKRPTRHEHKPSRYRYCMYFVADGERNFKCWYAIDKISLDISIHYDTYGSAPTPAGCSFKNDSDGMSDYYEKSTVIAPITAPDYLAILEACEKYRAKHKGYGSSNDSEYITAIAEAHKIAEAIADGTMTTAEVEAIRSGRIETDKRERERAAKEDNKAVAREWIAEGKATEVNGKAVYKDNTVLYEMFTNKKITEYTLIVIDLSTGERSKQCGRYNTEQERDTAEAQAIA